ncbi:hypothetical protein AVEN_259298-1 [Araneus ventricosus]|uniref:BTB domain-containing protein n=1 Tax=Araneus ventricosus TaxID=182803 RepID=A0A4Y2GLE7_ARAVE|nr:hypothetical protein AVEN_259298-1 [Araneus ventricosus]
MASDYIVCDFHFSWDILNPSVPWQRMETTFYFSFPTLQRWKVTLQPTVRSDFECCDWPFTFSLQYVRSGDSDDIVVADRLEVQLVLNKGRPCIRKALNYSLRRKNQHSFKFGANTRFIPTKKTDHLAVTVDISLPRTENLGCIYRVFDGMQLSEDLMRLFTHPLCSDLRLKSTDPLSIFPVHSYILHARWSNFFREHPVHAIVDDTVETNISNDVLSDILTCVYSGTLDDEKEYAPELFQVIRRYEVEHLYENFVNKVTHQERHTLKNVYTAGVSFDLHLGRSF